MPVPTCNLLTHRPTPTTASYTVSTRAPLNTLSSRLLFQLSLALRILVATCILVLSWAKWRATYPDQVARWLGVEDLVLGSAMGKAVLKFADGLKVGWFVPVAMVGLWVCSWRGYTGKFSIPPSTILGTELMAHCRRITPRAAGAGYTDHKHISYISIYELYTIHSNHINSGYLHP